MHITRSGELAWLTPQPCKAYIEWEADGVVRVYDNDPTRYVFVCTVAKVLDERWGEVLFYRGFMDFPQHPSIMKALYKAGEVFNVIAWEQYRAEKGVFEIVFKDPRRRKTLEVRPVSASVFLARKKAS